MPSYLSVCIQERDITDNKLDSSIIIIYDSNEDLFYLYGTRGTNNVFQSYCYTYHYSEISELCHFVKLVTNHATSKMSIDYNNIFVPDEDLDYVDFHYLKNKLNRDNEIIAFDEMKFKQLHLKQNLMKLFCIN
jgi:hypothetical protein